MTKLERPLAGRSAVITGASQGLGRAIARAYVAAGADVFLCARNSDELATTGDALRALGGAEQKVLWTAADVSVEADVARVAEAALESLGHVEILVSNAGVYGPKGALDQVDWLDWARAIEINLLGSALVWRALLPHFRARGYGKIVQLSGGGATAPLPRLSAYAASKAAVVRLVETVAAEVQPDRIDVNAVAPGALNTRLLDEVLAAGPERVGAAFYERAVQQKAEGGTPLDRGAELCVFLGSAASDGITGRLISAVWDPWEDLSGRPDWREELARTDVYTLRRIVPSDRGLSWDQK